MSEEGKIAKALRAERQKRPKLSHTSSEVAEGTKATAKVITPSAATKSGRVNVPEFVRCHSESSAKQLFDCTQDDNEVVEAVSRPVPEKTTEELAAMKLSQFQHMQDPLNWEFICLNEDHGDFEAMGLNALRTQDLSYTGLREAEEARNTYVMNVAKRMFRYRQITVGLIRKNAPEFQPNLYIKHELFAEKIGSLAYRVATDSAPIHLMSAERLKSHLNLDNEDLAIFIERMAYYDVSEVIFDYEDDGHDAKQVMVVHKSTHTSKEFTEIYKWKIHDVHKNDPSV